MGILLIYFQPNQLRASQLTRLYPLICLVFEYSNNRIKKPLFVFTNMTLNHSEASEYFNRLFE